MDVPPGRLKNYNLPIGLPTNKTPISYKYRQTQAGSNKTENSAAGALCPFARGALGDLSGGCS